MRLRLPLFAGVAALASLAAGCGDSSTDPAEPFVGAWEYTESVGSVACPGHDAIAAMPRGNKVFARGVDYALVDLSPSPLDDVITCNYGFDVAGAVATAKPAQGCAITGGDLVTVSSWTFTLNSPKTAEELAAADETITLSDPTSSSGTTVTICKFTLMAHLQRVAKD